MMLASSNEKHPVKQSYQSASWEHAVPFFRCRRNVRCKHILFMCWVDSGTIEAFKVNSVGLGPGKTDRFASNDRAVKRYRVERKS